MPPILIEQHPAESGSDRFKELGMEYAQLAKEKRTIEAREKEIRSRMELLQESLLESYQEMGMQRMTVDGVTIYVAEEIWAGGAKVTSEETGETYIDRQLTCDALLNAGY